MNIPVPKFVSEVFNGFTTRSVLGWLKQIMIFIVNPGRFLRNYYNQTIALQIDQLVFYLVLFGAYYLILFDNTEVVHVYKNVFNFLFLSVPFIIVNCISVLLLVRRKFNLWLVVSMSLIFWLLFSIPGFTFFKLFIENENYTFYLLSNFTFMALLLYQLFAIWSIVTSSFRKILLGYLLNIILFNIVFIAPSFIFFDAFSKDGESMDPLFNEFNYYAKHISTFKGRPYSYEKTVLLDQTSSRISFATDDSLFVYHEAYIPIFRNIAIENVKYIDTIYSSLRFERNKLALAELKEYFRLFNEYFDHPPCDTCLIEQQVYVASGTKKLLGERKEYQFEYPYLNHLDRFNTISEEVVDLSDRASTPFEVFNFILYPSNYLMKRYGDTTISMRLSL